jgi:hypothetical protein
MTQAERDRLVALKKAKKKRRASNRKLPADMQPMETYVEQAQAGTRFSLLLIGVFAVMAALLAGVGGLWWGRACA